MALGSILGAIGRGVGRLPRMIGMDEIYADGRTPPFVQMPVLDVPEGGDEPPAEEDLQEVQMPVVAQPKSGGKGSGRKVGGILGNLILSGIDAAATPNVARGGATDIFRAMQAAQGGVQDRQDRQIKNALTGYGLQRQQQMDSYAASKDAREWERANEAQRHNQQVESNVAGANLAREKAGLLKEVNDIQNSGLGRILSDEEFGGLTAEQKSRVQTFSGINPAAAPIRIYRFSNQELESNDVARGKKVYITIPEDMRGMYGGKEKIAVPVADADSWQKMADLRSEKDPTKKAAMVEAYQAEIDAIAPPDKKPDENKRLKSVLNAWVAAGKPDRFATSLDMAGRRASGQEFQISPDRIAASAAIAAAGAAGGVAGRMRGLEPGALSPEAANRLNSLRDDMRQDLAIKTFKQARPLYDSIEAAAQLSNGVGDLAMLRNFARLLDPNTGVREEEYRSMQSAVGSLRAMGVRITKGMVTGEQLTDAGRKEFLRAAKEIYSSYTTRATSAMDLFKGHAKRLGLDPGLLDEAQQRPVASGDTGSQPVQEWGRDRNGKPVRIK